MRKLRKFICVFLSVLVVCMSMGTVAFANDEHTEHDICHPNPVIGTTGTFNAVNYNVQGYPEFNYDEPNGRDVWGDSITIGRKLNSLNYDIVAIQEDFNYDMYLRNAMTNYPNRLDSDNKVAVRHQSNHSGGAPLGDGLNIFSRYFMYNDDRVSWEKSSGFLGEGGDSKTYKGIEVTTIELAKGYYLDIYNIHADEDIDENSVKVRQAQFTQLANYIMKHSVYDENTGTYDHAVLVTGDFSANIHTEDDTVSDKLVSNLLEAAHLNDAWAVMSIENIKEDPENYDEYYRYARRTDMTPDMSFGHYDSVERFCYASGNGIKISCTDFKYSEICDDTGRSLSDHHAAFADFSWEIVEQVQDIGHDHNGEDTTQEQSFLIKFLNYIASIFRAIGMFFQDYKNWFNHG